MDLNKTLENYKVSLSDLSTKIETVKKQIAALNNEGQKLTNEANVVYGKIKAVEDLIKQSNPEGDVNA
jgi:prefoldin subunit 5